MWFYIIQIYQKMQHALIYKSFYMVGISNTVHFKALFECHIPLLKISHACNQGWRFVNPWSTFMSKLTVQPPLFTVDVLYDKSCLMHQFLSLTLFTQCYRSLSLQAAENCLFSFVKWRVSGSKRHVSGVYLCNITKKCCGCWTTLLQNFARC